MNMNIKYYQQTPIMRRILDHTDKAVYVKGMSPHETSSHFRRHTDIMDAMGEGSDLYRSLIDFGGVNFFIDIEYGNNLFPGEIFHKPLETFEKIEGLRKAIKNLLEKKEISTLELMTGQGYNYVSKIRRDSASYEALAEVGKKLRLLPWSAAKRLMEKEQIHGNIPLLKDSLVFATLGKITEYVHDEIRKAYSDLPMQKSDIFDSNEIAIFDTTQFGYFLYKRTNRIAFSLHQKSAMKPELGYSGPPISTITPTGLSLENRIAIRSDQRDNYRKAAELASEAKTIIPEVDISFLLTSYLLSETYIMHKEQMGDFKTKILSEHEINLVGDRYPELDPRGIFWESPPQPDWDKINLAPLSEHARRTIDYPNDLLLKPWDIRNLVQELREHNVPIEDIVSLLAFKYKEKQHNWDIDLYKNNPEIRAEYWVRSFT